MLEICRSLRFFLRLLAGWTVEYFDLADFWLFSQSYVGDFFRLRLSFFRVLARVLEICRSFGFFAALWTVEYFDLADFWLFSQSFFGDFFRLRLSLGDLGGLRIFEGLVLSTYSVECW